MTLPPDQSGQHQTGQPNFNRGYWYELHGYDWYYTNPLQPNTDASGAANADSLNEDEVPQHLHNDQELHFVILDIQRGVLDELPHEAGVTTTFAYLLQHYLENRVRLRASAAESLSTPPAVSAGNANNSDEPPLPGFPSVSVVAGNSYFEVSARSTNPSELLPIWDDVAEALADPKRIYHLENVHVANQSMVLMSEVNLLSDALRYRGRHYAGTLWHNDLALRTGLNGATLMPLDMTHIPRRLLPALDTLAHTLNPASGKVRAGLRTSHPMLMGAGFRTRPKPWTLDDVLSQEVTRQPAFDGGGTLETDDADALLSVSLPLTLHSMVVATLLARIVAQIAYETVGERGVLRADRYECGDSFVVSFAMGGDWSTEDGRTIISELMRIPSDGDGVLSDQTLAGFIDGFELDGHYETILYTRRVERGELTPDSLRAQLYEVFTRFHVPDVLAVGQSLDVFAPLLEPVGLRVAFGSGDGVAFPPPLEEGDLERDFLEPSGEHFLSTVFLGSGKYPYLAPHRVSISDESIVAEWFIDEVVTSALVRRLAMRWVDVRAWFSIGEATALMDVAGRVLFVVPTIYDRVGPLYSLMERHHDRVKARVLNAAGGELELRQRVRDVVAFSAQTKVRQQRKGMGGKASQAPASGGVSAGGSEFSAELPASADGAGDGRSRNDELRRGQDAGSVGFAGPVRSSSQRRLADFPSNRPVQTTAAWKPSVLFAVVVAFVVLVVRALSGGFDTDPVPLPPEQVETVQSLSVVNEGVLPAGRETVKNMLDALQSSHKGQ